MPFWGGGRRRNIGYYDDGEPAIVPKDDGRTAEKGRTHDKADVRGNVYHDSRPDVLRNVLICVQQRGLSNATTNEIRLA